MAKKRNEESDITLSSSSDEETKKKKKHKREISSSQEESSEEEDKPKRGKKKDSSEESSSSSDRKSKKKKNKKKHKKREISSSEEESSEEGKKTKRSEEAEKANWIDKAIEKLEQGFDLLSTSQPLVNPESLKKAIVLPSSMPKRAVSQDTRPDMPFLAKIEDENIRMEVITILTLKYVTKEDKLDYLGDLLTHNMYMEVARWLEENENGTDFLKHVSLEETERRMFVKWTEELRAPVIEVMLKKKGASTKAMECFERWKEKNGLNQQPSTSKENRRMKMETNRKEFVELLSLSKEIEDSDEEEEIIRRKEEWRRRREEREKEKGEERKKEKEKRKKEKKMTEKCSPLASFPSPSRKLKKSSVSDEYVTLDEGNGVEIINNFPLQEVKIALLGGIRTELAGENDNNTSVIVMGGMSQSYSNKIYLLYSGEQCWKRLNITLPNAMISFGAAVVNNKIYIFGGFFNGFSHELCYKLGNDGTWTSLASLNEKRSSISNSSLIYFGDIWVIGGYSDTQVLSSVEKYNVSKNTWTQMPGLNQKRAAAAAAVFKKKIIVVGGIYDNKNISANVNSMELFDPNIEQWILFSDMPFGLYGHSTFITDSILTICGGYSNGSLLKTVWNINLTDQKKIFTRKEDLNNQRYHFGIGKLLNGITVFGGSTDTTEIFDGNNWIYGPKLPLELEMFAFTTIPRLVEERLLEFSASDAPHGETEED